MHRTIHHLPQGLAGGTIMACSILYQPTNALVC